MQRRQWIVVGGLVGVLVLVTTLAVGAPAPVGADVNEGPATAQAGLSVGNSYGCALTLAGALKCWGQNNASGALGAGDNNNRGDVAGEMGDALPTVDLGTGRRAVSVSTGQSHTCAVLDDASLKCWGSTVGGQIGLGVRDTRGDDHGEMGDNLPTVDLGTGRTARAVSVGGTGTCALLDDGSVKCWGDNLNGQEGLGDTIRRGDDPGEMGDNLPAVDLGTGRTATMLSSGRAHECAILDDGSVKCWGWNLFGQLGIGAADNRGDNPDEMGDDLPTVDLGAGHTAVAISAAYLNTCALLDNGRVKCWGFGGFAHSAAGDTESRGDGPGEMGDNLPYVDLGTGRTAVAISTGDTFACALLDNGRVKCWGSNGNGQLGLGDQDNRGDGQGQMGDALPSVDLGTGRTATAIAAGVFQACARLDDGSIRCWGNNQAGGLGLGDTANRGDSAGEMGDALPPTLLVTPAPAMTVGLAADETSVPAGGTIHYHVTVTNTGNVGLTGLVVTSPTAPGCVQAAPTLLPGEGHVIDCSYTPSVDDLGTRNASVTVDSDQTSAVSSNQVGVAVTVPSGEGVVAGTVCQSVFPNDAAAGVLVAALDAETYQVVGMDVSAGDGTYAMLVPAGSVRLYLADTSGSYLSGFHSTTPTAVGDGATVTVDPQVQRATGGVEGRAVDTGSGDGIPTALALTINARTGQVDGGDAADEAGFWVVRNLRSEAHLVVTTDLSGAHVPEYFDGAVSPSGATPVDLVGGALQVLGSATMVAQPAPGGGSTVQGVVTGPGGVPAPGVVAVVLDAATFGFEAGDVSDASGVYSVPVDPGSYVVGFADVNASPNLVFEWFADRPADSLASATPVTAAVGAPALVDASLGAMRGTVAGTVTEDGSGEPLGDVWAIAIDSTGTVVGATTTAADGAYTLANVPAGGVRVRFVDLTGGHASEYHADSTDPYAGIGYANATVVTVVGGATTTVDAGLAPTP